MITTTGWFSNVALVLISLGADVRAQTPTLNTANMTKPLVRTYLATDPKATLVGQVMPDLLLTAVDGSAVKLGPLRGKPVLLHLWATWCGPCVDSMPAFNRLAQQASRKGMQIIFVDEDGSADDAADYLASHHYPWTNCHDVAGNVLKALEADGIPLTILIDGTGKIAYYHLGVDDAALRHVIVTVGDEITPNVRSTLSNRSRQ